MASSRSGGHLELLSIFVNPWVDGFPLVTYNGPPLVPGLKSRFPPV